MSNFINIDFSNKTDIKLILRHFIFSLLWILGFLIIFMGTDFYVFEKYFFIFEQHKFTFRILYILGIGLLLYFLKWPYRIAFLFYPIIFIFWFLPKFILQYGKIFLFLYYANWIYDIFKNIKIFIFNATAIMLLTFLYVQYDNELVYYLVILIFTYLYILYLYRYVNQLLSRPKLFGFDLEKHLQGFLENKTNREPALKMLVIWSTDSNLELIDRKNNQIRRTVFVITILEHFIQNLKKSDVNKSFIISSVLKALLFLFFSIFTISIINYHIYLLDHANFNFTRSVSFFDFIYYSIKTIVLADVSFLTPASSLAKLIEISSFIVHGVFFIVFIFSVFISRNIDILANNIKLASDFFKDEVVVLDSHISNIHGTKLNEAISEIKNINESIRKIRELLKSIF